MTEIATIGVDIAKSVFQVHAVATNGEVVLRRRLRRAQVPEFFSRVPPCLVGLEACPSAHHWGRLLGEMGHDVRLMPPSYVKPYVKRQKNDMTDAEAICEAVTRPSMRFVPVKSVEQQSVLALHRTRDLLIRHATLRRRSSHGTGTARPAAVWPRYRASGRSRQARWRRRSPTHPCSARAGIWPPGWGSHRGSDRAAASSGWDGYRSRVTPICAACWWSVRRRCSGPRKAAGGRHRICRRGRPASGRASPTSSSPCRSPTRWRASHGPS